MRLRQFITVMGVVALVAVIYSPSTIGFSASPGGYGGTSATDTSGQGTSMFLSYLRGEGYHVFLANTSTEAIGALAGHGSAVYVLVGPDVALDSAELRAVQAGFQNGTVSALISEGNSTNGPLLQTFGAAVSGAPVVDPSSSFQDKRVFTVGLALGPSPSSSNTTGVIDIASSVQLDKTSILRPVATVPTSQSSSSSSSCSAQLCPPLSTVVAAGVSRSGSRALLITDSAPFTNYLFNYTDPQAGVNERAFVGAMVGWTAPEKNTTVVLDNSRYLAPKPPSFSLGLPVGPLVTYVLEQYLSTLNSYYSSFPAQVSGFLGGLGLSVSQGFAVALVAIILLLSVYGAIAKWFAPEKKGNDDRPVPRVERGIVAQSRARADFLQTSHSRESYVATLAELYEVLDSIAKAELGTGVASLEEAALAGRVGGEEAGRAMRLFASLSRIHDYAAGKRRLLLPPVLRWRALTSRLTSEAETFLNRLGITIAGEEEAARSAQRMDDVVRERVRA